MLKLARFAKQRVAVVLGGDGGDELFGGYERYRLSLLSSLYRRFPAALRAAGRSVIPALTKLDTAAGLDRFAQFHFTKEKTLLPLLSKKAYHPRAAQDFFTEHFFPNYADTRGLKAPIHADEEFVSSAHRFFAEHFFPNYADTRGFKAPIHADKKEPFETQFMKTNRESWLVDESLLRSDKLSMAAGLEARVPLLDFPLIDLADTIPLRYKVSLRNTKIILKEAFRGRLPERLFREPKRGWFSPGAKWLRYPDMANAARDILSKDYTSATADLFDWDEVRKRLDAHIVGEYHATILLTLLGLQVWAKKFNVTS